MIDRRQCLALIAFGAAKARAIGADTDNTADRVEACFGDLRFAARP